MRSSISSSASCRRPWHGDLALRTTKVMAP
jgi:hypothetical protein